MTDRPDDGPDDRPDDFEPIPVVRVPDDARGAEVVDRGSPDDPVDAVLARLSAPLEDVLLTQRAVRKVRFDPVDDRIVLRCIELALKAPTGSNGQNWEFVVVKDRAVKAQLARTYRAAWSVYGGIGKRVKAGDEAMTKVLGAVEWQVRHFEDIPVLVVACLRGARVPLVPPPPIAASSYYGSIYPSVQNLLLAARAMGLGASLITLPLLSTTLARRAMGLPISVHPTCVVPLGWPRGRYGPTTRRPVGDVVHLDRYGDQPWKT
jgi:nitroreductase